MTLEPALTTPTPPSSSPAPRLEEITGPYDGARFGICACHGEPVSDFGRCHALNLAEYPTVVDTPLTPG